MHTWVKSPCVMLLYSLLLNDVVVVVVVAAVVVVVVVFFYSSSKNNMECSIFSSWFRKQEWCESRWCNLPAEE